MSQWGKLDNIGLAGTVTAAQGFANVESSSPDFTAPNVSVGDALVIEGVAYRVDSIESNTALTLDTTYTGTSGASKSANVQQSPKDLSSLGWTANADYEVPVSKRNVYGIDRNEIQVTENKERGIAHTGWVYHDTYTTTQGAIRNKSEVLVAMSKNFASNTSGALFGTGAGIDANDDSIAADYTLTILTQPTNDSATAGNSATFLAAVASTPDGAAISYQWFESPNNEVFTAISDGGEYSGATTNTLVVGDVSNLAFEDQANVNEFYFRLVASADGGTDSVTSDTVYASQEDI
jgi:hypothetical protein